MKLSAESRSSVVKAVKEAMSRYLSDPNQGLVTDIYLQALQETGELVIYNDDEEELSRTVVSDWVGCTPEAYNDFVELSLKQILESLRKEHFFEKVNLLKPYSLVLVDDEKETVSELMLIDEDETMFLSDELLKGLDEELNSFLKELLES